MLLKIAASGLALALPIVAQLPIYDIWSTTWDRDYLFTYTNLDSDPIDWTTPGTTGTSDIIIDDSTLYQDIVGFGAALTDSSALLLSELKSSDSDTYTTLLTYLFDATDGADAAGFSYLRVPLGASDFSSTVYSFDDVSGDTSLDSFDINNAPSYLYDVLLDIIDINDILKIHVVPWSPPGWMKDTGTMLGGTFDSTYIDVYANYLLKCLQGYQDLGINVWAIGIQNEPQNSDTTYPTCLIDAATEAQIGLALRTLMDDNGFSDVIIIGYEHNWDDAGEYPVELMEDAASAFAGVSFHCYAGVVSDQEIFYDAYPDKNIYFTECTGEFGSDWWSDIKWYMNNIFIGSVNYWSQSGAMWNLVLNGDGGPLLPGTDSCSGDPCRGVVTLNSNGTYNYNQEFYAIAQASKAIIPKDTGGPFGQRIGVSVDGNQNLIVSAFVTNRTDTDWLRYSIVVLNQNDGESDGDSWDPVDIDATIEFRGVQASYTFPVGVTTLWWYDD